MKIKIAEDEINKTVSGNVLLIVNIESAKSYMDFEK